MFYAAFSSLMNHIILETHIFLLLKYTSQFWIFIKSTAPKLQYAWKQKNYFTVLDNKGNTHYSDGWRCLYYNNIYHCLVNTVFLAAYFTT